MTAEQYQNLIDLRGVAERGPELRDMCSWGLRDGCNTIHCWAGQYAVDHPGRGVWLTPFRSNHNVDDLRVSGFDDPYGGLATHFGLSRDESIWLFEPGHYESDLATRDEMLRRVNELLAKYAPAPSVRYRPECGESAYAMAAVKVEGAEVTHGV